MYLRFNWTRPNLNAGSGRHGTDICSAVVAVMDLSSAPRLMTGQLTRREKKIATKQHKRAKMMQSQSHFALMHLPKLLKIMVSRAGLEPATTALKVRRVRHDLRFHAQNTSVWQVPDCSGMHRMFVIRYQTRCQTDAGHRDALAVI
jgi:hypothetical protein